MNGPRSLAVSDRMTQIILRLTSLTAIVASIVVILYGKAPMETLKLATGYAVLIFLFLLSMAVLLAIVSNKINLSAMLEEMSGGASLARFQLLVFTFVIAFSFFIVVANKEVFPDIPNNVLMLLGISASTYGVGKGLQISSGQVSTSSDEDTGDDATDAKKGENKNE